MEITSKVCGSAQNGCLLLGPDHDPEADILTLQPLQ